MAVLCVFMLIHPLLQLIWETQIVTKFLKTMKNHQVTIRCFPLERNSAWKCHESLSFVSFTKVHSFCIINNKIFVTGQLANRNKYYNNPASKYLALKYKSIKHKAFGALINWTKRYELYKKAASNYVYNKSVLSDDFVTNIGR